MTWKQRYVHHKGLLTKGYTEVGIAFTVWNTCSILLLLLDKAGIKMSIAYIPLLILLIALILYLAGRIYFRLGLFQEENRWYSIHNPAYHEMMDKIEREKKND